MQMQKSAIFALASLPAREILRAPIPFLLTSTVTFATLFIPLVLAFQFGDTGRRLVRDGGLGLQLTIGILLAAASASTLIRRERESGVAAMLLTKPVARHWYLLSRFAGIAMVIMLFSATTTLATLLAHRAAEAFTPDSGFRTDYLAAVSGILCIPLACATAGWLNWRNQFSFHAVAMLALPLYLLAASVWVGFFTRAGRFTVQYNPQLDFRIMIGAFSLLFLLWVFAALALTCSIILPPVTTAALCMMVLFSGQLSPLLLARSTWLGPIFALFPNWNWFWLAEQLDTGTDGLLANAAFAATYGLVLLAAILTSGMLMIEKVEVPA